MTHRARCRPAVIVTTDVKNPLGPLQEVGLTGSIVEGIRENKNYLNYYLIRVGTGAF